MYPVQSVAEAAHGKKMPRNSTTRPSESVKKSSFETNKNATVGRTVSVSFSISFNINKVRRFFFGIEDIFDSLTFVY